MFTRLEDYRYRERVSRLIRSFGTADGMAEAKEALQALVERIVLTPAAEGTGLDLTDPGRRSGRAPAVGGGCGRIEHEECVLTQRNLLRLSR